MSDVIAATTRGRVRGATTESAIHSFLGIPYGESPTGARRFRPPLPAEPWDGVRDALAFGPTCPQAATSLAAALAPAGDDCLVLNVWTSALNDGAGRPVMVWLHGGGFRGGSASRPVTNGANLAKRGDVVVVSLNHRLNALGFLELEDVCGPDFAGSGVAGMLDIVLALEWVRDNIEAFGGDPSNVTVFGASGGGRKVSVLMGMPAARGLFHRAIIESGAHPRAVPRPLASLLARRLFGALGLEAGDVEALQAMPGEELFGRVEHAIGELDDPELPTSDSGRWMTLSPVLNAEHLPAHPFDPASPEGQDVPLIIGTNKDEMALFLAREPGAGHLEEAALVDRLRRVFGDRTEHVIDAHRRARPEETPWDLLVSITSEDRRLLSIETAEAKATQTAQRGGAPVYMYLLTWESDHELLKAAHTMEIPFVFHNLDATPIVGTRADRFALADLMSDTWIEFARAGDPNHERLPRWDPYDPDRRATMLFDSPPRLEDDPRSEERLAWGDQRPMLPWEGAAFVGSQAR
jgi:para-nitrobenzyl esterase